ncbi:hypothetical protein Tco_0717552, partial [Tanacetum coccineum]
MPKFSIVMDGEFHLFYVQMSVAEVQILINVNNNMGGIIKLCRRDPFSKLSKVMKPFKDSKLTMWMCLIAISFLNSQFSKSFLSEESHAVEPKLYDGNIIKNTSAIVILDSKETLMLAEEGRSKMLLKQKDHMMLEKKVNTTPVDYVVLNKNTMNSPDPTQCSRVDPPKLRFQRTFLSQTGLYDFERNLHAILLVLTVVIKEKSKPRLQTISEGSFTTLEKHCISLEVDTQLNQEIFQKDNSVSNQSALSFDQLFELNELKAQLEKRQTILKKGVVKALFAENKHLKHTYKQLYDSIKPARIRSKEQCDDLINQVNLKSVEISDLNASLQKKVLVIIALKGDLRKLKGKALVDNDVTKRTIDPEMLKNDVEPITPKLLNNRTAHSAYIKHTQEEAAVLRDLVEHVKANYLLDHPFESAC